MDYLRIRNWDKWQTYRKDRGQPPWIKIHRCVMRDVEWVALSDAQRGQLVGMWLLAADRDGVIPASPTVLKKLCHMDSEPDLKLFMEYGFIDHDANVASAWRQSDVTDTDTETKAETEAEADNHPTGGSENFPVSTRCPTSKIVDLYHKTLPTLPQCKKLTTARRAIIRQRHIEDMEQDLETWESYFNLISRSDFLMGRATPRNGSSKPFVASLDWICKAENFAKIYEGKYHG